VNRSPLARRIVAYNLAALVVLVAGVLYLDPFRDSLLLQRETSLVNEVELIAAALEMRIPEPGEGGLDAALSSALEVTLMPTGIDVYLLAPDGRLLAAVEGDAGRRLSGPTPPDTRPTVLASTIDRLWTLAAGLWRPSGADAAADARGARERAAALVAPVLANGTVLHPAGRAGQHAFWVGTPIERGGATAGILAAVTNAARLDALVTAEREQVLRMFVAAILVSVGISLALASTIATPLVQLSSAAEIGRSGGREGTGQAARVRIPDMTGRTDEIGRLSGALRGMVGALYDRIDANAQFAADVAHEIKNPLASLRSATGTLRVASRPEQRERLLEVIDHDVRRLDRLVSDISNASRLDAELVKEEEERFDLLRMLGNLAQFLGEDAKREGIAFLTDLPPEPVVIAGLEGRLAQVFVNLIGNAISFCEEGDAIRVWVRRREDRVLVVVEDTGPGIPDAALRKIFARFYSERPEGQFGNNSGLGLAISKQIVDAHGGVIWAENIRPTEADPTSEPLGARFVVGLPV
jgi:two-component system sensor histidine kinase ChvG